jgi:hypothetical protein
MSASRLGSDYKLQASTDCLLAKRAPLSSASDEVGQRHRAKCPATETPQRRSPTVFSPSLTCRENWLTITGHDHGTNSNLRYAGQSEENAMV